MLLFCCCGCALVAGDVERRGRRTIDRSRREGHVVEVERVRILVSVADAINDGVRQHLVRGVGIDLERALGLLARDLERQTLAGITALRASLLERRLAALVVDPSLLTDRR